jgi:hypothetical protein
MGPGGSGCTYGSGNCGGVIYGFTSGPATKLYHGNFDVEFLFWVIQLARASGSSAGKHLVQQQAQARIGCESDAAASRDRANRWTSLGADTSDSIHNPMPGGPTDYEPEPGPDYTIDPNSSSGAGGFLFGHSLDYLSYRSKMSACAAQNTLGRLGP